MKVKLQLYNILVTIAIVVAIHHTTHAKYLAERPNFLASCHLQDSHYNKCLTKNFQVIFREWKDGVPGLKTVGVLDPLNVKRILISQDPKNPVALNADLSNVVVTGASNIVVKDASFNADNLVIKAKLFAPKLRFDSDYKLNGRILNLALNGNGKLFFEVENTNWVIVIHAKLRDEYGFTFTDFESVNLEIKDIGGFRVHFDNLFNGQKALEDSTNAIFNENWRDFYEVLRPAITQAVEAIIGDRLKKILSYVPSNYLIGDIPTAVN